MVEQAKRAYRARHLAIAAAVAVLAIVVLSPSTRSQTARGDGATEGSSEPVKFGAPEILATRAADDGHRYDLVVQASDRGPCVQLSIDQAGGPEFCGTLDSEDVSPTILLKRLPDTYDQAIAVVAGANGADVTIAVDGRARAPVRLSRPTNSTIRLAAAIEVLPRSARGRPIRITGRRRDNSRMDERAFTLPKPISRSGSSDGVVKSR